jgi:hypothetical protein
MFGTWLASVIELLSEAADFKQTVQMANEYKPDGIVMDFICQTLKSLAERALAPLDERPFANIGDLDVE